MLDGESSTKDQKGGREIEIWKGCRPNTSRTGRASLGGVKSPRNADKKKKSRFDQ